MSVLSLDIKRCCDEDAKYVFVYDNNKVMVVGENHCKKIEYTTGVITVLDFETKKKLNMEDLLS